ncbi:hypothetical protein [Chitinophaga solisilvae]|uniref:hypothetical protein n=1 Tax=Chitinophaga solisilvae TaxID=1233460 RepID=UPI00136DC15A|nr:hypothetical protein [Chitinophaga solisilvae]
MSELLHYIDDYFTGTLSAAEKQAFEMRCTTDQAFAQEVAFYLSARSAIREELHAEKRQSFTAVAVAPPPTTKVRRLWSYLAAAVIAGMLLAGWWIFSGEPSVKQLSARYIKDHLQQLSATMDSGQDSLQSGIAAFNRKDYQLAAKIFGTLSTQQQQAPDAIKYLGLVYLNTGAYDQAIVQFDRLIQLPLYANPGPFYKALALLQRAGPQDRQQARELLEEVRSRQLPGNQQATEWLKKI